MCFLTLPVFACVIHYLWLGREIAQCNWSESRYGIILSLVFRVFATFTIIISEVMKSKEKLSRNYHRSDVVKFYTSMFMFMLVKKERKNSSKNP